MLNLSLYPRNKYTQFFTPIEKAARLSNFLEGPTIYFKRDDLLGLTEGGNKTRKLEFLIADAQAKGADTIITAGGIQSNHCRLTLAACVKENLNCILVLEENQVALFYTETSGNFLLYQLLGANAIRVFPNGTDLHIEMDKIASEIIQQGSIPYVIPIGGSNEIGATGYVACAEEIIQQEEQLGVLFDYIICTSGSGGMHAGLLAGLHCLERDIEVIGINISRAKDIQEDKIYKLTKETITHLNGTDSFKREKVICFDDYVGPGYALPTEEMVEAVTFVAQKEAILLDPVYTGKAMAGLIGLVRNGFFKKNEHILFLHSGGKPATYAYAPLFLGN